MESDSAMASSAELIRQATDPLHSVVVRACAGGGKTHLLASRIVRILLAGESPGDILAITFTRKAAAEIEDRVFSILGKFANSQTRATELKKIGAMNQEGQAKSLMRKVALSQPPMTVNTFHGWFLQLLRHRPWRENQYPIADVSEKPTALHDDAWENLFDDSPARKTFAKALSAMQHSADPLPIRALLSQFISKRTAWKIFADAENPIAFASRHFDGECGIENNSADDFADAPPPPFDVKNDSHLCESLRQFISASACENKDAANAREMSAKGIAGDLSFDELENAFFTGGNRRKRLIAAAEKYNFESALESAFSAIETAKKKEAIEFARHFNIAALTAGERWLAEIEKIKSERRIVEFDDLEREAWRLLADENNPAAMEIQFKLDRRYRHILIDEFQDTSPMQWQIVRSWLHSSHGGDSPPCIFIVGDARQSVYRFRGGEPKLFEAAEKFLCEHYNAIVLRENRSQRCAPKILDAVNKVFAGIDKDFNSHKAARQNRQGRIEILPLINSSKKESSFMRNPLIPPPPFDATDDSHSEEGNRIAKKIADIKSQWAIEDGDDFRPCRYDDMMILVRQKTHLMAIESSLRANGIPYQSGGVGNFLSELECADIIALLSFVCAPHRDLKLAQILKSPLFSLSDNQLAQAAKNSGDTLWDKLQKADGDASHRAINLLQRWRQFLQDNRPPAHDFLERIYAEGNVLARYRAAAPPQMADAIVGNLIRLIELSLQWEGGRRPLLPRFIGEMERLAADSNSSLNAPPPPSADAVKINTVHGAKGLESPIVFLADANAMQTASRGEIGHVICGWPPESNSPAHFSIALNDRLTPAQIKWRKEDADAFKREENNLLYVAMTRAKNALIVSGVVRKIGKEESWHQKISGAILSLGATENSGAISFGDDLVKNIGKAASQKPKDADDSKNEDELEKDDFSFGKINPPPTAEMRDGELRHRLIALILSGVGDDKTLRELSGESDDSRFNGILAEARRSAESPQMKSLLANRRIAVEAELVDKSGEPCRMDLLAEDDDSIWIIDFKADANAESHAAQLNRYRLAVAESAAGKKVRCAVVQGDGTIAEIN